METRQIRRVWMAIAASAAACTGIAYAQEESKPLSANRLKIRESYIEFARTLAPAGTTQGSKQTVWDALEDLDARRAELIAKHTPQEQEEQEEDDIDRMISEVIGKASIWQYPDIEEIYRPREPKNAKDAANIERCRELGLRYLNDCIDERLFDRLDEALALGWSLPPRVMEYEYLGTEEAPGLNGARHFGMLNRARMRLALDRGDMNEYVIAFDQLMRLSAVCARYPGMTARRTAMGITTNGCEETMHALRQGRLDASVCERLERSLEAGTDWPAPSTMFQAFRYAVHDAHDWFWERYGYASGREDSASFFFGMLHARGCYHIGVFFTNLERLADMTVVDRAAVNFDPEAFVERRHPWHVVLHTLLPSTHQMLKWSDATMCDIAGVRTMLALEQYKARHQTYPESLAALTPEFLATAPVDTYSGAAPIYEYIDHDEYRLYSVGLDGRDDEGKAYPRTPRGAQMYRRDNGYDYVFRDDSTK